MEKFNEKLFDLMLEYASKALLDEMADEYPNPEELEWK